MDKFMLDCVSFQWQLARIHVARQDWFEAAKRLEFLRDCSKILELIGDEVVCKGNIPLQEFGIDEQAVVALEKQVHAELALFWLGLTREFHQDPSDVFRGHAQRSGKNLSEFGTSEEELCSLDEAYRHREEAEARLLDSIRH